MRTQMRHSAGGRAGKDARDPRPAASAVSTGKSGRDAVIGNARQRAFSPASTRAGMTLVEIMVAMAIFVTVLSGTLLLFNGAISTVRQGYRTMEAFEKARGSMTVLERDLTGAFTARELGQQFQFYGRPNGFTFVGTIDGKMARVTYAVNPQASPGRFRAELVERYGLLNIRAIDHDARIGRLATAPTAVALAEYLQVSGQIDPNFSTDPGWLRLLAQGERAGQPFQAPMDQNVIIPIEVQTGGLVRYVEEDTSDTNDFKPIDSNGVDMSWPSLDELRFAANSPEGISNPVGIYLNDGRDPNADGTDLSLYRADLMELDERVLALQDRLGFVQDVQTAEQRLGIDEQLVTQIYNARKRDLWVRLIASDLENSGLSYWDKLRRQPISLTADQYTLADSIVIRALPLIEIQPYQSILANFDLLNINDHYFDYGIAVHEGESSTVQSDDVYMRSWWNSEENMNGLDQLTNAINSGLGSGLTEFNDTLVKQLQGNRVDQAGLPLRPKLPEVVQPRFWIMMENPWVGSAEFKRWFTQLVQVPAGDTRGREETVPMI